MAQDPRPILERRTVEAEFRTPTVDSDAPGTRRIAGLACGTNVETELAAGVYEVILPSAFSRVDHPESRDVKLLLSHSAGSPLASRKAKTLGLKLLPTGLHFSAVLADTQLGRDTYESIRRGDLSGASIGFRIRPGGEAWETRGTRAVRVISDLDLFEISTTAMGAQIAAFTHVEQRVLDAGRAWLAHEMRAAHPELAAARARLELADAQAALAEAASTSRDLLAPRRQSWQGRSIG